MKNRKLISILLIVAMMFSIMPTAVWAGGENNNLLPVDSTETEHKHCVCGSTTCRGEGHNPNQVWAAWDGTGTANVLKSNKYVYLSQTTAKSSSNYLDLQANNTDGVEYLCLHGNTWNSNRTVSAIDIEDGKSLTVTDCSENETGIIKYHNNRYNSNNNYGCIYIYEGHFTLLKGTIEHKTDSLFDCAICTYNDGSAEIHIKGGTIDADTGIQAKAGTVTIDGGTILATNYGTYMSNVATLNFNDGTIDMSDGTDPNSVHGIAGGKVYMKGGTVKGGNIGIRSNADLEIEGGTIENNKIGVMKYTGDCYVRGGTFKNNTDAAIQYWSNRLYLSGNPKFEGNTVDISMFHSESYPVPLVYMENEKTLSLDEDATIKVAFGSRLSAGTDTKFTSDGFVAYKDKFISTQGYPISVDTNSGALMVKKPSYSVAVDSGITNGRVTVSKTSAAAGETVTIMATPVEGYEVDQITVTGASGEVAVNNGTFTMPAEAVTVSVAFKQSAPMTYNITLRDTDGVTTGGSYNVNKTSAIAGDTVTITPTPAEGYEVDIVTYQAENSSATEVVKENGVYTFTMPAANVTVSVTFKTINTSVRGVVIKNSVNEPVSSVLLNRGETITFYKDIQPDNATNQNVVWSSSDVNVASIEPYGEGIQVSAVAPGKATITVTTEDGSFSNSCEIWICGITQEPNSSNYTVVTSPSGAKYQWHKVESQTTTVTAEFLNANNNENGVPHGNYESESGWTGNFVMPMTGYFVVKMNAGDILTAQFASPLAEDAFLYGMGNGIYADVTKNENTYIFKANVDDNYLLLVPGNVESTALYATLTKNSYRPLDGQNKATLDTEGLENGTYACKVTWDMGNDDSSDDYTLISEPVEYTAPTTDSGDDEDNSSGGGQSGAAPQPDYGYSGGYYVPVEQPKDEPKEPSKMDAVMGCHGDASCPMGDYVDIDTNAWYHDGVHYCLSEGILSGYGDGIFKPEADTSRAMIAAMLWRLEGNPVVNYALDYKDVQSGEWYTEAIRWMVSEGLATGYGNGSYGPNDAITREQLAAILRNYAIYKGYDVSVGESTNILSYGDAFDVSDWAYTSLQWACGSGVVGGMRDTAGQLILAPAAEASRAQVATMMMRFCEDFAK